MKSLPDDVVAYHQTPEFSESTIPAGLLGAHSTKAGVWGRIRVVAGSIRYRVLDAEGDADGDEVLLEPGFDGVVEPGVEHQVEPCGPVRFFVEFLR